MIQLLHRKPYPKLNKFKHKFRLLMSLFVLLITGISSAYSQKITTLPIISDFRYEKFGGNWIKSGNAELTATGTDNDGEGVLRLTDALNNQTGYAFLDDAFLTTDGVSVIFDFYAYGGTGADGFTLFLFDMQ